MKVFKACTKQERSNGKKNWPEIGTFFLNDDGNVSGFLNSNPDVKVYLFEVKPRQDNSHNNNVQNASNVFNGQPVSENNPF